MKNSFQFAFILVIANLRKSNVIAINNTVSLSASNITSNSNSDNLFIKAVSPKPEKNFDIASLITLFTKPTTTVSTTPTTTTTTASSTNTTSNTTACTCGKGAKPNYRNDNVDDYFRIQNGTVSSIHAWPWSVALVNVTASPNYALCGGSLISRDYILTAAHCFGGATKAKFIKDIRVYLGTNKINGNSTKYTPVKITISSYKIHPKYSNLNFDVAVIRLATPVTFNSSINPVCLSQTGKPFAGKNATTVGWGNLFLNQSTIGSNVLREVGLKVLGNTACNTTVNGIITPQMICAVGNPTAKAPCKGDSGGGLFYKKPTANTYTIIGITSFGPQIDTESSCRSPSVFTRVSSVIDFIKGATMNSTTYCSNTFFP